MMYVYIEFTDHQPTMLFIADSIQWDEGYISGIRIELGKQTIFSRWTYTDNYLNSPKQNEWGWHKLT